MLSSFIRTAIAAASIVAIESNPATAADEIWVDGQSSSCALACKAERFIPFQSGEYANGKPFFICRTDAGREGKRVGYNLQPDWSNVCMAGFEGKEEAFPDYECLCWR